MLSLFQKSVLRHHLQTIDTNTIQKAYQTYKSDFLPKIANIKTSKEEQYQYGFLDDLFVKVLGYTLNPPRLQPHSRTERQVMQKSI